MVLTPFYLFFLFNRRNRDVWEITVSYTHLDVYKRQELHAIVAGTGIKGQVEDQILPYGVDNLFVFDAEGLFPYTAAPRTVGGKTAGQWRRNKMCIRDRASIEIKAKRVFHTLEILDYMNDFSDVTISTIK